MAFTNTSLTFSAENQSLWGPGNATELYIDTGDALIFDPDEVSKHWGIDIWVMEAGFETYLDFEFGLVAWANLGTTGLWEATYEIDVLVKHPNAVEGGDPMVFDFSRYNVRSAEISSLGFGPGEDGISAGLDLIVGIEAGVRDIYVDWPWPFGDDNFGGFKLIDLQTEIPLIKVSLKLPEYELQLTDDVTLTARLPLGADTDGESENSGVVSGDGTSDTSFIELAADLDALLLELLGKIPEPTTQATVKFLGETVFAEFEYDLGDYVSFIPDGKIKLEFTFVDIEFTAGLALTEEVTLDIRPDIKPPNLTPEQELNLADVLVRLESDNGTPDNPLDDLRATTRLGYSTSLASPRTIFDAFGGDTGEIPTYGTTTVTAEYSIDNARFEHDIGLALTFGIEISILKGALAGSWVPGFLEVEFGPLVSIEFPDPEGDEDWDVGLGTIFSHGYDVPLESFNTETATYEVFFVQPELAPTGWEPSLPGAEEAIYGYFEAIYAQNALVFAEFSDDTFENFPKPDALTVGTIFFSDASKYDQSQKIFYSWTGATDNKIYINNNNGSVIMVAPSVRDTPTSPLIKDNLRFSADDSAGVYETFVQYNSDLRDLLYHASVSGSTSEVAYEYNGKTITIANRGDTNVRGGALGDVAALYEGGTYYDGAANESGQHDVFIGNFAYFDTEIQWDLAESINTGEGVRIADAVDVYNFEAMAIVTGNKNDYLVGGAKGDVMVTLGGDDIVKNRYYVTQNNQFIVDVSDDYISLGAGNDTALMELGNIPTPQAEIFIDWVIGGTGEDSVFIRSGLQGLRWNAKLAFTTSNGDTIYSPVAGPDGVGSEASHGTLARFLGFAMQGIEENYLDGDDSSQSAFDLLEPNTWISIQNGNSKQGEIRVARDVENISVIIDEGSPDQGLGDDLLVFMGGTRYDGGVDGTDTLLADFEAYEFRLGTRNGVQIDLTDPDAPSYFGQTVFTRIDRLHVHGTSDGDVIIGGLFEDEIYGGGGDDFLSGGLDQSDDKVWGEAGDDRFFWTDNGNDTFDGGSGNDILSIMADEVLDDPSLPATSPDYKHGGNHAYEFFDSAGNSLGGIVSSTSGENVIRILDALRDGDVAFQQSSFNSNRLTYSDIEHINIKASTEGSDAAIYQGGLAYDLGERQLGNDRDLFVADFRGQLAGIEFQIGGRYETETGQVLANGVYLSGMERAVILAGDGNDIMGGGWLDDTFYGGDGNDILSGNGGNDVLNGGLGNDRFYYDGQGYDEIDGGTNPGDSEFDHLIIGGFRGYARVVLEDNAGNDLLTADRGMVRWDNSSQDLINLAEESLTADVVKYYVSTPGNPRNWYDQSLTHVEYTNIEAVDIAGSSEFDDVILYQNGVGYVGGERDGDADVFVADLRGETEDLTFIVDIGSGIGYDIGQGTEIADFERMVILMGDGSNLFEGGALDDAVIGGAGQDELSGGLGDDFLVGGAGEDIFNHIGGHDIISGGEDSDVLNLGNILSPFSVSFFDPAMVQLGKTLDLAISSLTIADFQSVYGIVDNDLVEETTVITHGTSSVSFKGIEEIVASGSAGDDVLISGSTQGVIFAGDGKDVLIGRSGNDFLSGGDGNDTYAMGADFGQDIIFGEIGGINRVVFAAHTRAELTFVVDAQDLLITVGDNSLRILGYFVADQTSGLNFTFETTDEVFTETFVDNTMMVAASALAPNFGGDGIVRLGTDDDDDFYEHTDRADVLRGFAGDDFFQSSKGADLLDGGAGRDAVSYLRSDAAVQVDLATFRGFGGDADGDLLVSIEHVDGSLFDDDLKGTAFRNNLFGNDGDDTLEGRGGDDHLTGDEGDDTLLGGSGNDLLYGGQGDDSLSGGSGIDYLSGGAGKDFLSGGDDADILDDGLGDDVAEGGNGDDIFIYSGGQDSWSGDAGKDTADFDLYEYAVYADISAPGLYVQSRGTSTLDDSGPALFNLVRLTGFENLRGSLADDELIGSVFENRIEGNLGNDLIVGGDGIDLISGGAGYDVVDYGRENGTFGIDVRMSASFNSYGIDTFGKRDVLSGIEGIGGTEFEDRIVGSNEDNRLFGRGADDYLNGVDGDDYIDGGVGEDSIFGGNGNDTLLGGADRDVVRGNDGDDLFIEGEGSGSDTYYGGIGFDTVSYATVTVGINVDLEDSQQEVKGDTIETDALYDVENIIGGQGDDIMKGNNRDNWFSYVSGFDTFDGRDGTDTAVFKYFDSAVEVDLGRAIQARTRGGEDVLTGDWTDIATFTSIESVIGSGFADHLIGTAADESFFGDEGSDLIEAGAGSDKVFGGDGSDRILAFEGDGINLYDGGDGVDILDYSGASLGVTANLLTGDGDDIVSSVEWIIGTDHGDTLVGNAANNILQSGIGDYDLLEGGAGDDLLIYTGGNEDYFYGQDGVDTADYSPFGFAIDADLGEQNAVYTTDTADWDVGNRRLITVFFDQDIENLIGTSFNDRLVGNDEANAFNDGLGDDIVMGKGGKDSFTYVDGLDDWNGGDGEDIASFASYRFATHIDLTAGTAETNQTTELTNAPRTTFVTLASIENVIGTSFGDVLIGDGANNMLSGLGGNDRLDGGNGDDGLAGGSGDDLLLGGLGADYNDGGEGIDVLDYSASTTGVNVDLKSNTGSGGLAEGDTFAQIENLIGSDHADVLTGDSEANTLWGGLGDDTYDGGAGGDLFIYGGGMDTWNGGDGQDTGDFSAYDFAIDIDLSGATDFVRTKEAATLATGDWVSLVDLSHTEHFIGTEFDDSITGDSLANFLIAGGGNDRIAGGYSNDRLEGGDGDDLLIGGRGDDILMGGAGRDTASYEDAEVGIIASMLDSSINTRDAEGDVYIDIEDLTGSAFGDILTADNFNNTIRGEGGHDELFGAGGDDTLIGGIGHDTLHGGAGDDVAVIAALSTEVVVVENNGVLTISGADGIDILHSDIERIAFSDRTISFAEALTLGGPAKGTEGPDVIVGTEGNDEIDGLGGDDIISGLAGEDALFGGAGNDTLNGDRDDDSLDGGAGDDTLNGGLGEDRLRGGPGADRMVGGQNSDFYYVDHVGDVVVELAGDVGIDRVASGVNFDMNGSDLETLILGGSANTNGTGNDKNNYILGSLGNNIIRGGGGNDRIEAAGGDDTLYGDGGNDILNGGPGSDVFYITDIGDKVAESRRWEGTDHVISTVDFRMGSAHIETLKLEGTARLGAGNGLMNTITGNDSANILDGGKNVDTLIGGLGDDIYLLRSPGDTAVELENGGIDTVRAFRSIALGDNIENLYIQTLRNADGDGVPGVNGIGNALDNIIVGNPFDNFITGREGQDVLRGQAGADTFVFDRALGPDNVDRIVDFNTGASDEGDRLFMKSTVFTGIAKGGLGEALFVAGTDAADGNDRFVFDQASGQLWFDVDGVGGADKALIATFDRGATVDASDIFIV